MAERNMKEDWSFLDRVKLSVARKYTVYEQQILLDRCKDLVAGRDDVKTFLEELTESSGDEGGSLLEDVAFLNLFKGKIEERLLNIVALASELRDEITAVLPALKKKLPKKMKSEIGK